jgi:hypothetical protein
VPGKTGVLSKALKLKPVAALPVAGKTASSYGIDLPFRVLSECRLVLYRFGTPLLTLQTAFRVFAGKPPRSVKIGIDPLGGLIFL